jgi:hypothetical protein
MDLGLNGVKTVFGFLRRLRMFFHIVKVVLLEENQSLGGLLQVENL